MSNAPWGGKRKRQMNDSSSDDEATKMYSEINHVYFNGDVTMESAYKLNKCLRSVAQEIKRTAFETAAPVIPIYLHITTYGGYIMAAWSVVDCISGLGVPVYSVVDGVAASAGTLISLAAQKHFIQPNAYMMVHELSSSVWGSMSAIECEAQNLKNMMEHIRKFYVAKTKFEKDELDAILLKDVYWNAEECISRGLADLLYKV